MATDSIPRGTTSTTKTVAAPIGFVDIVSAVLAPLASLKLTVVLLFLAVLVTFIATLDQTRADVYTVKMKHFESAFVAVPFQTFFVPAWFPERQNIPGSFYLPSGLTILIAMIVNLLAAHILRFKLTARGGKLVLGMLIAGFATFMTWAIIFNGPNANGFQGAPPISWQKMWTMMQIGVLGIGIASGVGYFTLDKSRVTEKMLLAIGALLCIGALTLTLFLKEKAFIGDSAMRILWQLVQATIAGLVAYLACFLLFNRKAGIVLVHLGIAGLMFNEIYVTVTNEEQRMTIFEGQTVATAVDIRHTEMAIMDVSDSDVDKIMTIPGKQLRTGDLIANSQLPFDVRCTRYMANSDIRSRTASSENLADSGLGIRMEAYELPLNKGTDSDQNADYASAYVEILNKEDGESLGTYLISQNLDETKADAITIDDTPYHIALRFKTAYKPYSMTLKDAQQENYLGTSIPRWYSSDVVLNDFENNIASDQKIFMNNPLRYSGETFYQSGMDTLPDGRQYTVLQVVKNHGWMIPYVCCMFTVVGLVAQFGVALLAFLDKQRKSANSPTKISPSIPENDNADAPNETPDLNGAQTNSKGILAWVPIGILVIFGFWGAGEAFKAMAPKVANEEMKLDLFGKLPVTINGRVQPLDSVARNTARQLSKREFLIDGKGEKQEAIRWLADTLFEAEGYEDYHLFRIEDDKVISALELPASRVKDQDPNKRFRFSFKELLTAEDKLMKMIPDSKKPAEQWDPFEKRLAAVASMIQRVYGAKLAFGRPEKTGEDVMMRLESAGRTMSSPLIPLIVPTSDQEKPWLSMMSFQDREWLNNLAKANDASTTLELAKSLIEKEVIPPLKEQTIRERIIQRLLSDPEFVKVMDEQYNETDPRVLMQTMLDNWDQFPEKIKSNLVAAETPLVEAMIAQQMPRYEGILEKQVATINGSSGKIDSSGLAIVGLLNDIRPAYLAKDAEKFNSTLTDYLAKVDELEPRGLNRSGVKSSSMSAFHFLDLASVFALALLLTAPVILAFASQTSNWKKIGVGILCGVMAVFGARYLVLGGSILPESIMSAERFYNAFSPFYVASLFYLIAMMIAAVSWVTSKSAGSWNRASIGLLQAGLLIHMAGLILRVIISGRPPVTNLYSSVLFVSAAFVFICLIKERITNLGVGSFIAGLGGYAGLLWAWTMAIASGDTFTVMVAVLDTQFWLATHVVCISTGYAATFAAGLMGTIFILSSLVSRKFVQKTERRLFINVMYGIVCFGLLCSFFGTVLGGLWGDDSWGRFWGWDPKENGALMIVLWNAIVLHARWGGMVKERGLAALAILGNVIVLWSWKGVNELGVGLHAYAGTEDPVTKYILMTGVVHCLIAALVVVLPAMMWRSFASEDIKSLA